MNAEPHVVYRVFDAAGELLYIGCTRDINARLNVHTCWGNNGSEASLFVTLYGARVETTEYPNREVARDAEKAAIRAEAPWFNRLHNPTRFRQVRGRGWVRLGCDYPAPANFTEPMSRKVVPA